jgi:hypothetical protein
MNAERAQSNNDEEVNAKNEDPQRCEGALFCPSL